MERPMRDWLLLIIIVGSVGCTQREGSPPPDDRITFMPRGSLRDDDRPSDSGRVPGGEGGITPVRLETGWFTLTGPAVAGSASITDAVVWDPFVSDMPPFGMGGVGTEDVTVEGR